MHKLSQNVDQKLCLIHLEMKEIQDEWEIDQNLEKKNFSRNEKKLLMFSERKYYGKTLKSNVFVIFSKYKAFFIIWTFNKKIFRDSTLKKYEKKTSCLHCYF